YFLRLYGKYIAPVAETYAYCLLRNHFHFAVRIKAPQEHGSFEEPCSYDPSKQFATFFGTYTKAINKAYKRTGTLFEGRFKRKPVENDQYLTHLITYIHWNPAKHGFVDDYGDWPYSSYQALISSKPTQLSRENVLGQFEGLENFQQFHRDGYDLETIAALVEDDFGP
ncbi:MAG: hypothetical protein GY796_31755, partial [Chloroflexi bacterium]|nr:hypothetical protein [Chloroflexota bacterium]